MAPLYWISLVPLSSLFGFARLPSQQDPGTWPTIHTPPFYVDFRAQIHVLMLVRQALCQVTYVSFPSSCFVVKIRCRKFILEHHRDNAMLHQWASGENTFAPVGHMPLSSDSLGVQNGTKGDSWVELRNSAMHWSPLASLELETQGWKTCPV